MSGSLIWLNSSFKNITQEPRVRFLDYEWTMFHIKIQVWGVGGELNQNFNPDFQKTYLQKSLCSC